MGRVADYYKKYVDIGHDGEGVINSISFSCPENFNFSYDIIDKYAELEPDRRALIWTDVNGNERVFTFSDLSEYSGRTANLFLKSGIKKGDKIMLVLKRNYQYWFAVLGLAKIGAVAIPATHMLTAKDYIYRFENAGVTGIVATGVNPEILENVDAANKEMGGVLKNRFVANRGDVRKEGWVDFDAEIESQPYFLDRIQTSDRDMMLLYFTSGTTGYPKMVSHSYRYALWHVQTATWHNINPESIHLTVADTGWAKAAWGKLYGQMILGATVFVYDYDRFVPSEMLKIIEKYKVSSFCAPPTLFRFFIKEGLNGYDLYHLKYCTIAGEALNPEVYEQWLKQTGIKLMEGFGQTEVTLLTANFPGMNPKPGSMGKPTPMYKIDIVDENGISVPVGETGEIVVKAQYGDDGLFDGYYMNSEMTENIWKNGIYHTGDTAWADEDGYYWYVGRNDDIIKSSGYRIGPFEVESVLITHPSVLECAVTGEPDPTRGQVVKATVVLAKGYEASEELKKELEEHVAANTAPYKKPRFIEFVNELPKTISGKIRRIDIRGKGKS
ncbi:MAG: AMP-binding protein [Eubacterium sp.]|jgi:acetyl-CoA synthetase|nr:AMP-binding protein [Eubacterium sp.]